MDKIESFEYVIRMNSCIQKDRPDEILSILKTGEIPPIQIAHSLKIAATLGRAACIAAILPYADNDIDKSKAFITAAEHNQLACLRILAANLNSKEKFSKALQITASNKSLECAEFLYHLSDANLVKTRLKRKQNSVGLMILETIEQRLRLLEKTDMSDKTKQQKNSI